MVDIESKLATSFHRGFKLRRAQLAEIVQFVAEYDAKSNKKNRKFDFDDIRDATTLGTVQVQAMRRYARGVGILNSIEELTRIGRLISRYDPELLLLTTLWLMHYHLAAPHKLGPVYWNKLVAFLQPGDTFRTEDIIRQITLSSKDAEEQAINPRSIREAATVFTRTYVESECLGNLELLTDSGSDLFVNAQTLPSINVFGWIFSDYWRAQWGDQKTVSLSEVTARDGLAGLLFLNSGQINELLGEMQSAGLLQLQRRIPPYLVERLWDDPDRLLERIYE